jgi:UDP-glucose:tetrahydrobiopterin glucosyltransferase
MQPVRRILLVTPPVGPIGSGEAGGVETHLLHLAPILVERGYALGVAAPAGSVVPVSGITVYQVDGAMSLSATRASRNQRSTPQAGGVLENMWETALRVQDEYDFVVGASYDWLPFYLTPFFKTPVGHWVTICSAIDEVDSMIEKRWREGGLKLAMYTDAQVKTFAFLKGAEVALLYGGVDSAVFRFEAAPADRLCWAGRISPEKGLEDAIAAAAELGMPLDVCGKIQDEAYWRATTRDAGTEVVYRGFLEPEELQKRYGGARATLATPRWVEAFGNTVIESLACGTPVVTYDRGGPAEIVEDGTSGALVPFASGAAGLAAGVRAALGLDRRAARERAEDFTFARMADRFEAWVQTGTPQDHSK